ncbi:MAG: hypothetical protein JJ891_06745 [Rhizobiaceae bacterium]|nr:hypothetical protein [Rhizobiaceae bacterium]
METKTGMKDDKTIRALLEAVRLMEESGRAMTLGQAMTFLGVVLWGASNKHEEPLTLVELSERIGIPYTSLVRHIRYLGEEGLRPSQPGLGLISSEVYLLNRRQKVAYLTPKGLRLAEKLKYIVSNGRVEDANNT